MQSCIGVVLFTAVWGLYSALYNTAVHQTDPFCRTYEQHFFLTQFTGKLLACHWIRMRRLMVHNSGDPIVHSPFIILLAYLYFGPVAVFGSCPNELLYDLMQSIRSHV
ncbi:hypothetical protein V8E53_015066 [Lactarius tabidus]